ncbi:MAG: MATE family efflux transporter [Clostridia bacterium]
MVRDMTKGNIFQNIFFFALPILFGNIFQQLYSIVDTIIVGKYIGEDALAAVGSTFPIIYMLVSIIIGFTMGSSVVISQYYGAGKLKETKQVIFTSMVFLSAFSVLMSVGGYFLTDFLLRVVNTPANIAALAGVYLRIYFFGLIFIFIYNILASIFQALGDSRTPLYFLIIASLINILLVYIFVVYLDMGVAGAGWATVIAQAIAALLCFIYSWKKVPIMHFNIGEMIFSWNLLRQIIRYGVPSSIQQMIFSLEAVFAQRFVNYYGSIVTAGYTAANKITSLGFLPLFAFSNAVAIFTGQNIGANNVKRAKQGLFAGAVMGVVTAILVMLVIYTKGTEFMSIFLDPSKSTEAIMVGVEYAYIIGVFFIIISFELILQGFLRGAGDVKIVTMVAITAMIAHIGLAYLLMPKIGRTGVWWSEGLSWIVGIVIIIYNYKRGNWKNKGVIGSKNFGES